MKTYKERLPLIDAAIEKLVDFDNRDCWRLKESDVFLWLADVEYQRLNSSHGYQGQYVGTRTEFNQRKAELQNKPSWSDAPEWAEWLCQNHKGEWMWFSVKPNVEGNVWCVTRSFNGGLEIDFCSGLTLKAIEQGKVIGNWQDTLEKRPETIKEKPMQSVKALLKDGMRCIDRDGDVWWVCGDVLKSEHESYKLTEWDDGMLTADGIDGYDIMIIIDRDDTVVWERESEHEKLRAFLLEIIESNGNMSNGILADTIIEAGWRPTEGKK